MSESEEQIFHVSGSMEFFGRWISDSPGFWRKAGNLETTFLRDSLDAIKVTKPVYVCGLARSGSTILLETLAALPDVATHRYKDFPPVYTPYWWNWFMARAGSGNEQPQERAHKDGIMVTQDSPEAMEEVLWMGAYRQLHNPLLSNVLDASDASDSFALFYKEHIQKLLLSRDRNRYVSKGNYLVSRLDYIQHVFPEARFIIPVRHPEAHIASLMKQHELFTKGQLQNPGARAHLKRVGHLEFGLDRVPINFGDNEATRSVIELWESGEEVRGWARYWNQVYTYLTSRINTQPSIAEASQIIRFEDLCDSPATRIRNMLEHCDLETPDDFIDAAASGIHAPTYYKTRFSDQELAIIEEETAEARGFLNY